MEITLPLQESLNRSAHWPDMQWSMADDVQYSQLQHYGSTNASSLVGVSTTSSESFLAVSVKAIEKEYD